MIITGSLASPSALGFQGNTDASTASTAQLIGTSGQFVRMAREGELERARRLWVRRSTLQARRLRLQHGLDDINDPNWLFKFSRRCEDRGLDFEKQLRARASRLEAHMATVMRQLASIDNEFPKGVQIGPAPSPDQFEGSTILRKGRRCYQIIGEVKRIRNMVVEHQRTVSEIRKLRPEFQVWALAENLPGEDHEAFCHPRQWGPAVGYAKRLLAKEYGCSPATVTNWVKSYRRMAKTVSSNEGETQIRHGS